MNSFAFDIQLKLFRVYFEVFSRIYNTYILSYWEILERARRNQDFFYLFVIVKDFLIMSSCNGCGISRAHLNGGLCKTCFKDENFANAVNDVTSLLAGELNVGDLVKIIKTVNSDNMKQLTALNPQVSTLEQRVKELEKEDRIKEGILLNPQWFLESLANKNRQCNVIKTGITEAEKDREVVNDIFKRIMGTYNDGDNGINMVIERLGDEITKENLTNLC